MNRLRTAIWKEWLILLSDRIGLVMMFALPLALVIIITIVQDSAFRIVKDNNVSLLVSNLDTGELGDSLVTSLGRSGMFRIKDIGQVGNEELMRKMGRTDDMMALVIPRDFSAGIRGKAQSVSDGVLYQFELIDSLVKRPESAPPVIRYVYDPVLQEAFRESMIGVIQSRVAMLEQRIIVEQLYDDMGIEGLDSSQDPLNPEGRVEVRQESVIEKEDAISLTSTQHNVPAWTIFAMFFMVVSLGGNLVRERKSGTFLRLRTIPGSMSRVMAGKLCVYFGVALLQITLIFSLGAWLFPMLGLPPLVIPGNIPGLILVSALSAGAAVSYALLVGSYAGTVEQANGFGAVTVVIFAAIGGIMVPYFVLPEAVQNLGRVLSPMYWCLEGYYALFLKGGSWAGMSSIILYLVGFIGVCQLLIHLRLKRHEIV